MGFVNYKNGNYVVYIDTETGDKIRNTRQKQFKPAFAENCDVTITTQCDGGCEFCYMGCTIRGKHGNLNAACLDTLHPYTELAINGNDLTHPDLMPFLEKMKKKRVLVNITVNQKHFEKHFNLLKDLQNLDLIKGIGVSLNEATDSLINKLRDTKNVIVHVISGIVTEQDMRKMMNKSFDILILGYKTTNRGNSYLLNHDEEIQMRQKWLHDNMQEIFNEFRTVEFDNLALDQLSIKDIVSENTWNQHYMGDDGNFTFFIDLVDGYFAKNSTSPFHYPLMCSVDEMFRFLQEVKEYEE